MRKMIIADSLRGMFLRRDASEGRAMPDFNRDGDLQRTMEVRSFDADKRTVELAFSSEIEVERWFGFEILDHDQASVRLDRLRDGGALLVNHDLAIRAALRASAAKVLITDEGAADALLASVGQKHG